MKKTHLLWFAFVAFLMLGCRSENLTSDDSFTNQQAQQFRVVPKSEIPHIISILQEATDNFKVPLKNHQSIQGKAETIFGDIKTDYIIETQNDGANFYIFPVLPNKVTDTSETYNLEIKTTTDGNTVENANIVVYKPTEDWLINGNDNYSLFSGNISTYSLDGSLETSIDYLAGNGGCTPPPCPDCPTTPQGPGGGTDGGGTPGGGWTGNGSGGSGGGTGGGGGDTGGGGGGGYCTTTLRCAEDENGVLKCWMETVCTGAKTTGALRQGCGGGGSGGVITVYIPSVYLNNTLTAINNSYALTTAEKNFLTNNSAITSNLANYIRANNNQQGAATIKWAINYLSQPQNSQIATYYNQNSVNLKNILFNDTNLNDADNIATNVAVANVITDFLRAKSSGNIDQIISTNNLISWDQIKINIKNYVKSKIPDAVRMGKMVYSFFKENIPDTKINALNQNYIDPLRNYVQANGNVNTDVHTMKWKDVVACWLFELGDFPVNNSTGLGTMPTIGFAGADYTISGIPNQLNQMRYLSAHKTLSNGSFSTNSVLDIKDRATRRIKEGNLTSFGDEWKFNFDAGVDTIKNLDGLQFTLGSYQTTIYITSLGNNQYKLTFIVNNKTGWTSGTRGLNNNDGNPNNDSGFPDKPIGTGIHLGGTIGETFGWYEIITIP